MTLFGYDLVCVINLARRADRRREVAQQLTGIEYELFPAYEPSDAGLFLSRGAHGCFLSHRAILHRAAKEGASVLIVEDDCDLTTRSYAVPEGTDIFYGGYEALDEGPVEQSRIIGSHLMGFSAKAAKVAADYLADFDQPGLESQALDGELYDPSIRPGIDGAYVWLRRAHPELMTHFATPPIGFQRRSRSDVTTGFYDRVPGLRYAAGIARAVLR